MSNDDNDNDDKKKDLTKIEDLFAFLHEDDPDSDSQLEDASQSPSESDMSEDSQNLQDLPDIPPDETNDETNDEISEEDSSDSDSDAFNFDDSLSADQLDDEKDSPFESSSEDDNETSEDTNENDIHFGDSFSDFNEGNEGENTTPEFSIEEDQQSDEDSNQFEEGDDSPLEFQTGDDNTSKEDSEEIKDEHDDQPEAHSESQEDTPEEESSVLPFQSEHSPSNDNDNHTDLASTQPSSTPTPKENFQDVRQFGKHMTYGTVGAGGNPPFSIAVKSIKFKEDADDILSLLREHGILNAKNEKSFQDSIEMGMLLISQISEYSAIYLAHRLRRYDLDLQIGLAEEIHPPKNYKNDVGLSSKGNVKKNKSESLEFLDIDLSYDDIITSTSDRLPNMDVINYLGVATEHAIIRESELSEDLSDEPEMEESGIGEVKNEENLSQIYQKPIEQLKKKALKLQANALLNITFHLSPLIKKSSSEETSYKLTCTANLAQVQDISKGNN